MLKRLQAWWKSTEPPPDSADAPQGGAFSDASDLETGRKALCVFVQQAFGFLGEDVAKQLARRIGQSYRHAAEEGEPDLAQVLRDGLQGDPFTGRPQPFAFVFDARHAEGAGQVISAVWKASGQVGQFAYDTATESADPVRVLGRLQSWAAERAHAVLLLDTGGDEYVGLFCPEVHADALCSRAQEAGVSLARHGNSTF